MPENRFSFSVDAINIGLMFLSMILAYLFPFQLFLAAYAILGPLHYLTEIRWLAKRNYFTEGRSGALLLFILGLVATLATTELIFNGAVFVALAVGAIFTLVKNPYARWAILLVAIAVSPLANNQPLATFFSLYLPTLVHVFLFTALFILLGALKAESRMGILSCVVFFGCTAWLVFFSPVRPTPSLPQYVIDNIKALGNLPSHFSSLLPGQGERNAFLSAMQFIAFAYTYHYLNWFSKTKVIRWHIVTRWEIIGIAVLYLGSIAIYAFDYQKGLRTLYFLSLLHVLLEFPLNFRSGTTLATTLRVKSEQLLTVFTR